MLPLLFCRQNLFPCCDIKGRHTSRIYLTCDESRGLLTVDLLGLREPVYLCCDILTAASVTRVNPLQESFVALGYFKGGMQLDLIRAL